MADNVKGIFGDYAPTPEKNYTTTPLQGLRSLGNVTHFETGCEDDTQCLDYNQTAVKAATHAADLVIVCLGTGNMILDGHWMLLSWCNCSDRDNMCSFLKILICFIERTKPGTWSAAHNRPLNHMQEERTNETMQVNLGQGCAL